MIIGTYLGAKMSCQTTPIVGLVIHPVNFLQQVESREINFVSVPLIVSRHLDHFFFHF